MPYDVEMIHARARLGRIAMSLTSMDDGLEHDWNACYSSVMRLIKSRDRITIDAYDVRSTLRNLLSVAL
jgi:hypothetical protein